MQTSLSEKKLDQLTTLNSRELSVRYYVDQGLTTTETASMLNLSPITIAFHELNLDCKLAISGSSTEFRPCLQS